MSAVSVPVVPVHVDPEEPIAPLSIETPPAQMPVQEVIVLSDADSDDEDPEEEPYSEEQDEPLEEPIDPEMEDALVQMGALVHQLLARDEEMSTLLQTAEEKEQTSEAQIEGLQIELHELHNARDQETLKRIEAEEQVQYLRQQLRGLKRKADDMNGAYLTSMGHVQAEVWSYPDEIGQFRGSISRARVIAITENERLKTVAHRIT